MQSFKYREKSRSAAALFFLLFISFSDRTLPRPQRQRRLYKKDRPPEVPEDGPRKRGFMEKVSCESQPVLSGEQSAP